MQHRTETRERILEAAASVFAEKGYHDALIDEIGRRTSMSKGGLYFHFPSKEHLFFAVMDRLANKLVQRAEKAATGGSTPLNAAEEALVSVLNELSTHKRLARLLVTQGYSMGSAFEAKRSEVFERFAAVIVDKLEKAKIAGEISDVDTDLASRVWLGSLNEVVVHWLFSNGTSPKDTAPELKRLLVASLRSPSGSASGGVPES